MGAQADLFGEDFGSVHAALPAGMQYSEEFLSHEEEAALLTLIGLLPLAPAQYKGFTARREVLSFGDDVAPEADVLPPLLLATRTKVARWLGLPAEALGHTLVARYRVGTPLGWHLDAPQYELVAGVSLGGFGDMRLRRRTAERPDSRNTIAVRLAPRSAYVLIGEARWAWQHSVPPAPEPRSSITFRTRRTA